MSVIFRKKKEEKPSHQLTPSKEKLQVILDGVSVKAFPSSSFFCFLGKSTH